GVIGDIRLLGLLLFGRGRAGPLRRRPDDQVLAHVADQLAPDLRQRLLRAEGHVNHAVPIAMHRNHVRRLGLHPDLELGQVEVIDPGKVVQALPLPDVAGDAQPRAELQRLPLQHRLQQRDGLLCVLSQVHSSLLGAFTPVILMTAGSSFPPFGPVCSVLASFGMWYSSARSMVSVAPPGSGRSTHCTIAPSGRLPDMMSARLAVRTLPSLPRMRRRTWADLPRPRVTASGGGSSPSTWGCHSSHSSATP